MDKLPDELQEFDDVVITGVSSSPSGKQFTDFRAVVSTIDKEREFIKVWSVGDAEEGLKIWFDVKKITSLRIMGLLE